jgi:ribosomal protein L23
MKSYVNFFIQKLEQFITAGMQYQEALNKLKPEYDKATPTQQKEIRNSVATLIGVKYREVPTLIEKGANKGTLGFERNSPASKALRRLFPVVKVDSVSTTPKKKLTAVDKLLKQFNALTATQRKAFLKEVV